MLAMTHTHAYTHACAHIHTQKAKPWAAVQAQSYLPSELALGHLCATQVLGVSADKSSWDRTSNPQEAVPCGGHTHTHTHTHTTHACIKWLDCLKQAMLRCSCQSSNDRKFRMDHPKYMSAVFVLV